MVKINFQHLLLWKEINVKAAKYLFRRFKHYVLPFSINMLVWLTDSSFGVTVTENGITSRAPLLVARPSPSRILPHFTFYILSTLAKDIYPGLKHAIQMHRQHIKL